MKKLSFMVILSVLTLVFGSSSVSFAKNIPEDRYTTPTDAEFSQMKEILNNDDIETGNLQKDYGVIVNDPAEKVGVISDIPPKKTTGAMSASIPTMSTSTATLLSLMFNLNSHKTMTVHRKPSTKT
ncbi:hypothetical protein RSC3_03812 [Bacillus paralicheniformis]|nr:hypothetical protein RSC3_03812 [Bacillus paralicheniformis]